MMIADSFELRPAIGAFDCSCSSEPSDGTSRFPTVLLVFLIIPAIGIGALIFIKKISSPKGGKGFKTRSNPQPPNDGQVGGSFPSSSDMSYYEHFTKVCYRQHIIEKSAFQLLNCNLGSGKFSTVYKGLLKLEPDKSPVSVAVKKFRFREYSKKDSIDSFLREIKTFEIIGTDNKYIVKFLGASYHEEGLYLLTEYCEGGSLRMHLTEKMRSKIYPNEGTRNAGLGYIMLPVAKLDHRDLDKLLHWCEQIACGMEYLSKKGIIHVDLACRNILLSGDGKVKICDFGLSRKCSNAENYAHTFLSGEFPFNSFAPECVELMVKETRLSVYVDIWAFGCTVWEIFMLGNDLYPTVLEKGFHKYMAVRNLLLDRYRHDPPPLAPHFVNEKLMECWDEIPRNRPNFTHLRYFFAHRREMLGD